MSASRESVAAALGLECYIGPRRAHRSSPRVPLAIARALDLSPQASVADDVRAIECDATARKMRERLTVVQGQGIPQPPVALSVLATNLHRIGLILEKRERKRPRRVA